MIYDFKLLIFADNNVAFFQILFYLVFFIFFILAIKDDEEGIVV